MEVVGLEPRYRDCFLTMSFSLSLSLSLFLSFFLSLSLSLSIYIYIYIYIFRSEGFTLTGYDIPGCVEDGAWMLWENSSVAAAVFAAAAVAHLDLGNGQFSSFITTSALPECADRSVSSSEYRWSRN